jgi:pimeloyl-ACP methyl ester carboxylesterase
VDAGFSLLAPSRPGYGRTPLEVGRTAEQAAAALAALLDSLGIPTCSLIATSGGGPTGLALAACFPQRVTRLALACAITCTENRTQEAAYRSQAAFYGPMHNLNWGMLRLAGRLSPRNTARQVLAIFSAHDPDDALRQLSAEDVSKLAGFFKGQSARRGALNDLAHTVGPDVLRNVEQPTLVIHSREDRCVPFSHAERALENIRSARLCEAGVTGHFFWVGPDYPRISREVCEFLRN